MKCLSCGKLHQTENNNNYLVFAGNVYVGGTENGIIGNNLDKNGKVKGMAIYCRDAGCIKFLTVGDPDEFKQIGKDLTKSLKQLKLDNIKPTSNTYGPVIGVGGRTKLNEWDGIHDQC